MSPKVETAIWMFRNMLLSRQFEEAIKLAYMEGKSPRFNMANGPIPGEMHLSNGQEPCAVGVCAHLEKEDFVSATHRPHHIAIAKGVDLKAMAAEIFGKETGLSGGRGGHMHLFDQRVNFVCSGIIAEGMGPAVGAALGRRLKKESGIAVSFIGEGAANQGAFHEALNLAAVWKAGVVFVIEDNAWGISVSKDASTSISSNADRAASYGMPGHRVDSNCPDDIYEISGEAIQRARDGGGPSLIEIKTVRLEGHFMGDAEQYRNAEERESLEAQDPLPKYRTRLLESGVATKQQLQEIEEQCKTEVDDAISFARSSALPPIEEAYRCVYA